MGVILVFIKSHFVVINNFNSGQVVREIHYRDDCVHVLVEDGTSYSAEYVILSVSLGVLQSKLIRFKPELPVSVDNRVHFPFILYRNGSITNVLALLSCNLSGLSDGRSFPCSSLTWQST